MTGRHEAKIYVMQIRDEVGRVASSSGHVTLVTRRGSRAV